MTNQRFLKQVLLKEHIRDHYRHQTLRLFRELLKSITLFGRLYHDSIAASLLFKNTRMLFKEKKVLNKPVRIERFLKDQRAVAEHIQRACEGQLVSQFVNIFSTTEYGSCGMLMKWWHCPCLTIGKLNCIRTTRRTYTKGGVRPRYGVLSHPKEVRIIAA